MLKRHYGGTPGPRTFFPEAGRYVCHLALVADNVDATFWSVEVIYRRGVPQLSDPINLASQVQDLRLNLEREP
jgi:hypothetical protein